LARSPGSRQPPALTYRDANAHSLLDFLDFSRPAFADRPPLAALADPLISDLHCDTNDIPARVDA
jgi:hypothetical protein